MQKQGNHLSQESSPYLLQHAYQPVDWYPWCDQAFIRAEKEDKPIFLSIGYSTCHWCHVMAKESFNNSKIADILNRDFISIKVDREVRPDLDSIYMKVCQAMTGSGGWPMSIFLTPGKEPFFAGTYFPCESRQGIIGFHQLLDVISQKWHQNKKALIQSAGEIVHLLSQQQTVSGTIDENLIDRGIQQFIQSFDKRYGGFGDAPKFPSPHNLLFLLNQYEKEGNVSLLSIVETTLRQMYRGGLFDHIGYGFSRYATDRAFQIPHFEKMLYDNAMMIMAYTKAFDVIGNPFYQQVAEQTADYILREMTDPDGGFYSAQDADSEGVEGRYYTFTPYEIIKVLGKETGKAFNRYYGITEMGNFNGKSIPHLEKDIKEINAFSDHLPKLREYRRSRSHLGMDDKILTAWNGLMIAAMAQLARITGKERYLQAAIHCEQFIRSRLWENGQLYASCRDKARSSFGYLDDYACAAFAMIELYQATGEQRYLDQAKILCNRAVSDFWDEEKGGFYLSSQDNEELIMRTKEAYDGAIPSGNSIMAYDLVYLSQLADQLEENNRWKDIAIRQLEFLAGQAAQVPMGHAFYLTALSDWLSPPPHIKVVLQQNRNPIKALQSIPLSASIMILHDPAPGYPLKDDQTTYYICTENTCLPPVNILNWKH